MQDHITIKPVSLQDFSAWIIDILTQVYHLIQHVSPPLFMIFFGLGAIMLVLGALFGAPRMRGAGVATLVFGGMAFLIINNAEAVISVLQGFVNHGP